MISYDDLIQFRSNALNFICKFRMQIFPSGNESDGGGEGSRKGHRHSLLFNFYSNHSLWLLPKTCYNINTAN